MIRTAVTEAAYALAGSVLALALLSFLHGGLQPGWAVVCGVLGAVLLRRLVGQTYAALPPFIRRPLDAGVATGAVFLTVWATLVRYPFPYWVLKGREVVSLPAAAALLGLGIAAVVYTHRRLQREIEAREARMAALREAELRARLRALQAQINPHFLFNSLNSLAELVHGDPDDAEQMVGDLAHLLRYSLRSSASGLVPLSQEIEAVQRYLRLERARLGDRIHVVFDVADEARDVPVPGLVLQPLVENAVKYAVAPRPEGGHVRVAAALRDGELRIEVEDDGPGLAARAPEAEVGTGGAGGGLANARQRLSLSYREGGDMEVMQADGGGTRIVLHVPLALPAPQRSEP